MMPDNRYSVLEIPAADDLQNVPQRVSTNDLPEIRVGSQGAGSLSHIFDPSNGGRIDPSSQAPSSTGWESSAIGDPVSQFADRALTCVACGVEFVFTAGEQAFFREKEFKNDPKRCKHCSAKRHRRSPKPVQEVRVVCAECGARTTVPFKPRNGKPVLCHVCFRMAKQSPIVTQPASPDYLSVCR